MDLVISVTLHKLGFIRLPVDKSTDNWATFSAFYINEHFNWVGYIFAEILFITANLKHWSIVRGTFHSF